MPQSVVDNAESVLQKICVAISNMSQAFHLKDLRAVNGPID